MRGTPPAYCPIIGPGFARDAARLTHVNLPLLPRRHAVLFALAALFICRVALALIVIPPWQQPDEQAHVAFAEAARFERFPRRMTDAFRQHEILRSMERHGWWRHYGMPAPSPLPAQLYDVPFANGGSTIAIRLTGGERLSLYYHLFGAISEFVPMTIEQELYLMRTVSALLGLLTLWVAWLAGREQLGDWAGAGIAALLAVHPQFVVVATTASPDAVANLAGACIWWQGSRAIVRPSVTPIPAVLLCAIGAAAIDRMGLPLVVVAIGMCAVTLIRVAAVRVGVRAPAAAAGCVVLAVVAAIAVWTARAGIRAHLAPGASPRAASWDFFAEFTTFLFNSWWFTLGWIRYRPPGWWLLWPYAMAAAAGLGVGVAVVTRRWRSVRAVVPLAGALLLIQAAAIYWTFYRNGIGAQGRYLFPMIIPALTLLWAGIVSLVPLRFQAHAAAGLVAAVALLDASAWLLIGIPAYAR